MLLYNIVMENVFQMQVTVNRKGISSVCKTLIQSTEQLESK